MGFELAVSAQRSDGGLGTLLVSSDIAYMGQGSSSLPWELTSLAATGDMKDSDGRSVSWFLSRQMLLCRGHALFLI